MLKNADQAKVWFYMDNGEKNGPVGEDNIINLIKSRIIHADTNIWCIGMNGWVRLDQSPLADYVRHFDRREPPTIPKEAVGDGYIWALSVTPLWGSFLQAIIAEFFVRGQNVLNNDPSLDSTFYGIDFSEQMESLWFVVLICATVMVMLDERRLSDAGYNLASKKLNIWLAFLIPVYIFKRDKLVGASMLRFWIWVASFIISVFYLV